MEEAIRESDFVLIVCTPRYREKSNARLGGVGYEGNIITAEMLSGGNERKFVPVLRGDEWESSAPSWLSGKFYLDFRGDPYSEDVYGQLMGVLFDLLPRPRSLGGRGAVSQAYDTSSSAKRYSPQATTRLKAYTDFANAALRVFRVANKRLTLLKQPATPTRALFLENVNQELNEECQTVRDYQQEFTLYSSEEVMKAAVQVAADILAAEMGSFHPKFEETYKKSHTRLVRDTLPKFREAVRQEAELR